MNVLRPKSILRFPGLQPAALTAPRSRLQVRFATQDYGSGDGNPAGEKPQKQGQNPSEKMEHPGPAAPSVAKGKSSSSPNSDNTSSRSSSSQQSNSSSPSKKRDFSTSSRLSASKEPAVAQGQQNKPKKSEVEGAQPKILNESPPSKEDESEDVKRHNEDMENRAEQAHEKVSREDVLKDKTGKK